MQVDVVTLKNSIDFIEHPWGAVYNENSKILILGTIPSPKSREVGFFYGHPHNIFWKTIAEILKPEFMNAWREIKKYLNE